MAQPYVSEIRMFAGNFAPAGWMFCAGQLLPISENETLFNFIGTTYGGVAPNFLVPNLKGREGLRLWLSARAKQPWNSRNPFRVEFPSPPHPG